VLPASKNEAPFTQPEPAPAWRDELRDVLRLSLPAVGEQILTMTVTLVNTIFVGHLGAASITAVGLAGSLSFLASTFFAAVATGATTLVAQAVGARQHRLAQQTLEHSLAIGLLLGIISLVVMYPLATIGMCLMDAEEESVRLGALYLRWLSLSFPFQSVLLIGCGVLRGAGDTRTPMLLMGGMNVANLLLSYWLIRGGLGIAPLEVMGAGIAAFAATVLGCVAVLLTFAVPRSQLRLCAKKWSLNRQVLQSVVAIGLPAGGEMLLFRLGFLAYSRAISSLGTTGYAAYLITQRLEGLFDMPAFGFGVAATTLVGQACGAEQPKQGHRAVFLAIGANLVWCLLTGPLIWILAEPLLRLFTTDAEVIRQGLPLMRIIAVGLPVVAVASSFSGGIRGTGNTRAVMIVTGIGSWLLRVPLSFASVGFLGWGLTGIQVTMFLDYALRAILLAFLMRPRAWARQCRMGLRLGSNPHD